MNCPDAENALLESLDQPLASAQSEALEVHLASCPACQDFAAAQRTLDAALHTRLRPTAPSPGFNARVMARLTAAEASLSPQPAAVRQQTVQSEHNLTLQRLQQQAGLALRRRVLDGAGFTALGMGLVLAAENGWPRLESAVAALLPGSALQPGFAVPWVLALAAGLAAVYVVTRRHLGASLWRP